MVPGISVYRNLPMPIKVGLFVITGVGIVMAMMFVIPYRVFWVVLIGLVFVALILLFYRRFLNWIKKRKAAPMERGVLENTSTAPQGISQAAQLARLDDLRKKFEEGITKFRAAGKSLYNFPWYTIVGEPGSGKTEAVRHCNVGFPAGLQDQLQGSGGTLNMNWWFTDHAVILDTAGRLMFEEVETGGSDEWKEFLKLLKKYRPRCPMNGVFLVIPADSLIKDTADEIEQKASKIARQFDVIQRTLDVRFPVFVVITKSDLINGFREFFDDLEDPQLQHQILGWSNPTPLDEPYNPDFVEQLLKTIQNRLFRRRLALLQEIVSKSDEQSDIEKKHAIHSLYAFPQSLAKIAPRMARYLEMIFSVGSQWSGKPLFFRGIYFTSSMREGSALDEDLAESLGVSVESLPEGRIWERDRAYFLRDLFMKKVFREKGLVTYATNAKKQHLRRKAVVLISAAASVVLLLFFTIYAGICFRSSIGQMKGYFAVPAKLFALAGGRGAEQLQVIKPEGEGVYRYIGRAGITDMTEDITRSNFSTRLGEKVDQWEKKGVPWIFGPAAKFARGIKAENLSRAQAVIYETGVLLPFLTAASETMEQQENGKWTRDNPEMKVLHQFIRLKAGNPLSEEGEYSTKNLLDPLFEYIFRTDEDNKDNEDFTKRLGIYNEDKANLHQPIGLIYGEILSPTVIKNDPNFLETAIEKGTTLFNTYWSDSNQIGTDSRDYAYVDTIVKLKEAFDQFDAAEQRILALRDRFGSESGTNRVNDRWEEFISDWRISFQSLVESRENIQKYIGSLNSPQSLEVLWANVAASTLQDVNDHYQFLLSEMETESAKENSFLTRVHARLEAVYSEIAGKLINSQFAEELKLIDDRFYVRSRGENHLYEVRFQMYSKCNEQFVDIQPTYLDQIRTAILKVSEGVGKVRSDISELLALGPTTYRCKEASDICVFALELTEQKQLYNIVEFGLRSSPKSIEELGKFIETQGTWEWTGVSSNFINRRFDPKVAEDLLGGWKLLGDSLHRLAVEANLQKAFMDANEIYVEYPKLYFEYWLGTVPETMIRAKIEKDSEQFRTLIVRNVFDELIDGFGGLLESAVNPLRLYMPKTEERIKLFDADLGIVKDNRIYDKFYNECRTVLNNWRELSDDVLERRRALLRVTPADYLEDYASFSYDSSAEFVDMYWTELTLKLLSILANQVQKQGKEAFENLRTQISIKFPLEIDTETNLTQEELVQAWSYMNRIRVQEVFPQGTIGAGANTGSDDVDAQLKLLREVLPPESYKQWFEGTEKVFQGLPQTEDPYYCQITLLGQNEQRKLVEQDEGLLLDYLTEFRLVQGDYKSERFNTRSRENLRVGMFKYPGDSIQIEFYQYPSDTEIYTRVEFSQPWASLRMLHQCYDKRKNGYIKLEVKSEKGLGGVLFLQLEFSRDRDKKYPVNFPGPEQWPSLKE